VFQLHNTGTPWYPLQWARFSGFLSDGPNDKLITVHKPPASYPA